MNEPKYIKPDSGELRCTSFDNPYRATTCEDYNAWRDQAYYFWIRGFRQGIAMANFAEWAMLVFTPVIILGVLVLSVWAIASAIR